MYNRDNVYYLAFIVPNLLNRNVGVLPSDMEKGIESFLKENDSPYHYAVWAPSYSKAGVIEIIERMISEGLPVVCSYYCPQKIYMYTNVEGAKEARTATLYPCTSHYMTIIGYTKYEKANDDGYGYVLKIVSWGKIYYINYEKYIEPISLANNILEIRK